MKSSIQSRARSFLRFTPTSETDRSLRPPVASAEQDHHAGIPLRWEWLEEPFHELVLYEQLKRLDESHGPLTLFISRLGWVPTNYPVQVDRGAVTPVQELLSVSLAAPDVLSGYWVAPAAFEKFAEHLLLEPIELHLHRAGNLQYLGSLSFDEYVNRQLVHHGNHMPTLPELSSVDLSLIPDAQLKSSWLSRERRWVETIETSRGLSHQLTSLGLSHCIPLQLGSIGNPHFSETRHPEQTFESLNQAFENLDLTAMEFIAFSLVGPNDEMPEISLFLRARDWVKTADENRGDSRGWFLFYDHEWRLRCSLGKTQTETLWHYRSYWRL